MDDYYHILGISKDASPEEIEKAWDKLPKTNQLQQREKDVQAYYDRINLAYYTLSQPDLKARYDHLMWLEDLKATGQMPENVQEGISSHVGTDEMYYDERDRRWRRKIRLTEIELQRIREKRTQEWKKDKKENRLLDFIFFYIPGFLIFLLWLLFNTGQEDHAKNVEQQVEKFEVFMTQMHEAPDPKAIEQQFVHINKLVETIAPSIRLEYSSYYWNMEDELKKALPELTAKLLDMKKYLEAKQLIHIWKEKQPTDTYERAKLQFECLAGLRDYIAAEVCIAPYATKLPSDAPKIYEKLAKMYEQAGDTKQSKYYYQKAQEQ